MTTYEAMCQSCGQVTEHEAGRCQRCASELAGSERQAGQQGQHDRPESQGSRACAIRRSDKASRRG